MLLAFIANSAVLPSKAIGAPPLALAVGKLAQKVHFYNPLFGQ
jgi:hypothetical protein